MQRAIKIKRIAKSVIENKVCAVFSGIAAMVFYSIGSHSTNRMQPEVKPCKAEIRKGKKDNGSYMGKPGPC